MSDAALNDAACNELAKRLLLEVRSHYRRRPQIRDTVFEAMQALAWTVAEVVAVDPVVARTWFDAALDDAIDEVLARHGETEPPR